MSSDQPSVHATLGFVMENVLGRARFIGFRSEKRREPLVSLQKLIAERVFLSKTEGCGRQKTDLAGQPWEDGPCKLASIACGGHG